MRSDAPFLHVGHAVEIVGEGEYVDNVWRVNVWRVYCKDCNITFAAYFDALPADMQAEVALLKEGGG